MLLDKVIKKINKFNKVSTSSWIKSENCIALQFKHNDPTLVDIRMSKFNLLKNELFFILNNFG